MKYKYIIFDLDGTLINPKVGQINSVKYALKYFNIDVKNKEKLCKFIGPPLKESFAKYYHFNDEEINIGIKKYREYFLEKGIKEQQLYEGIIPMLKELQRNGGKAIIATSNPTPFAEKIAELFNIKEYLYDICGSNLDGSRVFKEEILSYILDKNSIKKDKKDVVMIGDRLHDIVGAKKVGIDSIGVLYGYGSKEEIDEANPTYKIKTVEELKKLLILNN